MHWKRANYVVHILSLPSDSFTEIQIKQCLQGFFTGTVKSRLFSFFFSESRLFICQVFKLDFRAFQAKTFKRRKGLKNRRFDTQRFGMIAWNSVFIWSYIRLTLVPAYTKIYWHYFCFVIKL